jgi:transcription elongation GreA/GreB family factor
MNHLKEQLHRQCLAFVQERMDNARQAIELAEQSAEEDTKSSAGDKYETGREMLQQEKNRGMAQLAEANKLLVVLNRIGTGGQSDKVSEGSVVLTDNGNFYIAISAGVLSIEGKSFFAVSPASPIGAKLTGCMPGDTFDFNGKTYLIEQVM